MGKTGDEQHLPSTSLDAQGTSGDTNGCCLGCNRIQKLVSLRCVFVLMLGVAVILSAVFWLPFFHLKENNKNLDLDYQGHDVVASFVLKKPVSFLQDNKMQLESDIFDEMSFSNTKVDIISIEPVGSNVSRVVFAVESDVTTQSLIRAAFVSLITHQSYLHLTSTLFGEPFSFEVLKFRGGITASPEQKAYLMQKVQILFNFTLHFSIDQSLENFNELSSQLKMGLRLDPHETLYLRLTNLKGSTVTPPTIIQSQVLLVVGIPSKSRLKQLAQTITSSHAKNLGLNNTVFGRVKQVQLSSILEHSLGNDGNSPSPSPSPTPPQSHHHHHHHHRHHHETNLAPSVPPSPSIGKRSPTSTTPVPTPAPAPAPQVNNGGCHSTFPWKHNKPPHAAPTKPPVFPPHASPSQSPKISTVPVQSPLPNVAYAQSQPPPSKSEFHARSPDIMPLVSPSPSPSSAETFSSNIMALPLFILLIWCL